MLHSEAEIIQKLEAGNEICLNMLYDNYYRALCLYGLRFVADPDDAEDVVQDVFVAFWQNKKGTIFTGSVRSYLFGAVVKAASKFAVRNKRIMFDDVEKYIDNFLDELNEYDEEEFVLLKNKVCAEVDALPDKTREVFKAVVLENMTYQQVGERCGITVNTVKTLYYRALKHLKERLGGENVILFLMITR